MNQADATNLPVMLKLRDFESQVLYFNGMYKLPIARFPSILEVVKNERAKQKGTVTDVVSSYQYSDENGQVKDLIIARLRSFKKTISDEVNEVDDIIESLRIGFRMKAGILVEPRTEYTPIEFLVDMADWLADMQVYCASEMVKFGIPVKETIAIVMSSNFSKQGSDGKPIYDEHGKVLKGPGYWKPEPQIRQMLEEYIAEATADKEIRPSGIVWR